MRTLIVGLLLSTAVTADTLTTTFICTDHKGRKSIQDKPCPDTHAVDEVPTVQHQQTMSEYFQREGDRIQYRLAKNRCDRLRSSAQVSDRRQAIAECKSH